MRLLIIHLSDIHIQGKSDIVLSRGELIFDSIKNLAHDFSSVIFLISGDIAFSGKKEQYEIFDSFFQHIRNKLAEYCPKLKIYATLCPGNHDCDFTTVKEKVRASVLKTIWDDRERVEILDNDLVTEAVIPQASFLRMQEDYILEGQIIINHPLLTCIDLQLDNLSVRLNLYNISWLSQKVEEPGNLFFPTSLFGRETFISQSEVRISVLHHPLHWLNVDSLREFREHLEDTSDIILTGHEHTTGGFSKTTIEGNNTIYFEGGVLQESKDKNSSSFGLYEIDLEKRECITFKSVYDPSLGQYIRSKSGSLNLSATNSFSRNEFLINESYLGYLADPGAPFRHPRKSKLQLHDIFIAPDVKENSSSNLAIESYRSSRIFYNIMELQPCRILLEGAEKCGKSTLLKTLFQRHHKTGFVPLVIPGHLIKNHKKEDFNKLVLNRFLEIYDADGKERFENLDKNKIVLFIDDFDDCTVPEKQWRDFLTYIVDRYPNTIITSTTPLKIESILANEDFFSNLQFRHYTIQPFGFELREKLATKWTTLGLEDRYDETDLLKKCDRAVNAISTIIGHNLIPSYPIFLLTVLQTLEIANPNLKESSYGYYYNYLVTDALISAKVKKDEFEAYYNYLTELAMYLHANEKNEITKLEFSTFHDKFKNDYRIEIQLRDYLDALIESDVIQQIEGAYYKFRHRAIYYYFLARFIGLHINEPKMKDLVAEIAANLHRKKNANILLFLTHHTRDEFVTGEILKATHGAFESSNAITFNAIDDKINELLVDLPKLVVEEVNVHQHREKANRDRDYFERLNGVTDEESNSELDESDVLRLSSQLNHAIKSIEINGLLLKNNYASMRADLKESLATEAYGAGLRALNFCVETIVQNKDAFTAIISEAILQDELKRMEKNELEGPTRDLPDEEITKRARRFLSQIIELCSYSFIKYIANSLGNEKLMPTFADVERKLSSNAVKLINLSMKLDFTSVFPEPELRSLAKDLKDNILPTSILRKLVSNYLYMFPSTRQQREKIAAILEMSIQKQLTIVATGKENKN